MQVLYFGDNICSDCYPSKHFANWGAVLLLEEMDAEGYVCSDGTVPGHEGDAAAVVSGPNPKSRKVLEVCHVHDVEGWRGVHFGPVASLSAIAAVHFS